MNLPVRILTAGVLVSLLGGQTGYLHNLDGQVVDGNGTPVLLRGIGLGGWLVPEGYMLNFPGFGSATAIRDSIRKLLTEAETEEFFQRYRSNYVRRQDIDRIAAMGFNSVRLPMHYRFFLDAQGQIDTTSYGFAVIDSVLAWCRSNRLYLILDLHAAPGSQNPGPISDSPGTAELWLNSDDQDLTVALWRALARRYRDETWIGGYDLINEPVLPSGVTTGQMRALYMRITNAIREVDTHHLLWVEGNWYATDFAGLTPPFDTNMGYAFHWYWRPNVQSGLQYLLNFRQAYRVPLWMGEFGENSTHWIRSAIRLMEDNGVGWNVWTYKKLRSISCFYSAPLYPDYQAVLDYFNHTGPRPSHESARSALFRMADNLNVDSCTYRPDMADALFREDFFRTPHAFTDHVLPGTLYAAQYDLGANGVAYSDHEYQNTGSAPNNVGNQGWVYRNDGVDIGKSATLTGFPYYVGWMNAQEWLGYTVEISYGGHYAVEWTLASPDGSGAFRLYANGETVIPLVESTATGGWDDWKVVRQETDLPAGQVWLQISVVAPGANLQALRFTAIPDSSYKALTSDLYVGQQFPNPFHDTLTIPILTNREQAVSVSIWDLNGRRVRTWPIRTLSPGLTSIVWTGRNDRGQLVGSGTYLYRIEAGPKDFTGKVTRVK
ncbi:MAG: carbohydrate-binding protein [Candidatus Neomarinimicrobiota bacterium]|nr:MAG: carbohydrate-binding protein [Candidatus Neomarinimicrobiota bacterium]